MDRLQAGWGCLGFMEELQGEIRAAACVSWDLNGGKGQRQASSSLMLSVAIAGLYASLTPGLRSPPDPWVNPRLFYTSTPFYKYQLMEVIVRKEDTWTVQDLA
ncbi:hypothetical protein MHYP_G00134090 [Metynnis hypsauchen]